MKIETSSRIFVWLALLALTMLMLAACDSTVPDASQIASGTGIRVWLDQPPDDAHLPLAPYTLRAHARDLTGGGVSQIIFLVNRIPLETIPTDPTRPLVSAEFNWNPSVPGEYTVQAQASGSSGTASSEVAVVCVGPSCVQTGTSTPTVAALQPTGCKDTPVITSFTASPTSIAVGGSTTLNWSVSNADKIEMMGVGDIPAVGASSVSPGVTTTYTLVALCGGKENMVTQSVTVAVTGGKACSGLPVVSFTASPSSITAGASSTLQWTVTNADRVMMPDTGDVGLTGSRAVSPRTTTTYGIAAMCGGKDNLVEQSVTITVVASAAPPTPTRTPTRPAQPPPVCSGTPSISSFSASPSTISPGQSSTLSWAATNFDSVSIDQGIGGVSAPGSRAVSPGGTTIYTLTARCGNNTVTRQATVTVQAVPVGCQGAPNISSFSASPSAISQGQSATLNWGAVTNADSVSIDQGIGGVAAPGSVTVSPNGNTTYTMTARCGGNTVTRQATVNVSAPPPVDKTPPTISSPKPSNNPVYYLSGCGANNLTISANVSDTSGVGSVQLSYRYVPQKGSPGGWISVGMNSIGGNDYSASIPLGNDAYKMFGGGNGQIEFYVTAQDKVGNSGTSGTSSASVLYCPG